MSSTARPTPLTAVPAVLLALAGCSSTAGPPEAEIPRPTGADATACRALHAALPEQVESQDRRIPEQESPFFAQWGDPVISLRCGVSRPALLTPGSETYNPLADVIVVNDVAWLPEEQSDGYRFTTTEHSVHIELVVPRAYTPEAEALVDLARAISETVPVAD